MDSGKKPARFAEYYEIVRELGRGTTGTVYEARHTRLNRQVALKVPDLTPESERSARVQRFLQECRALAYLTVGPDCGIPRLYAVTWYPAGHPFCARELVAGRSLEQLATAGSLDRRGGLMVVAQAARVVHWVHEQGFAHRNLTPDNVLLAGDGTQWLIGFGRVGLLAGSPLLPAEAAGTPAEVDVRGLQELLRWLCAALRQPLPAGLRRAIDPGAVPTAGAFGEAVASYL
jgi:serine/threonine protein kinase